MNSPKNKGTRNSRYILSLRKVRSQNRIWVARHIPSTFKGLISVLSSTNAPGFPPHKIKKKKKHLTYVQMWPSPFTLTPNTKTKKIRGGKATRLRVYEYPSCCTSWIKGETLRFESGRKSQQSVMIPTSGSQSHTMTEGLVKLPIPAPSWTVEHT